MGDIFRGGRRKQPGELYFRLHLTPLGIVGGFFLALVLPPLVPALSGRSGTAAVTLLLCLTVIGFPAAQAVALFALMDWFDRSDAE